MSKINTFLQRRKMHENRHGFIMVVIAYALSIMMLFFGSDVFYNIKTTAAGVKNETDEATEESNMQGEISDELTKLRAEKLQAKYGYTQIQNSLDDTVWLLGRSMNAKEYDVLLEQLEEVHQTTVRELEERVEKEEADMAFAAGASIDTAKKTSDNTAEEATIKSLSIKAEAVNEVKVDSSSKEDTDAKSDSPNKEESKEEDSSQYVYEATAEEVDMLERIVQAEAGSEDMKGRILVANVVLNRVADDDFPDTIEEVIFQNSDGEYQFSPVSDKRFWSVKVTKKTKEAVQRALQGEDVSEGALYFMARKRARTSSAKWFDNNLKRLFKHGGHEFFK